MTFRSNHRGKFSLNHRTNFKYVYLTIIFIIFFFQGENSHLVWFQFNVMCGALKLMDSKNTKFIQFYCVPMFINFTYYLNAIC